MKIFYRNLKKNKFIYKIGNIINRILWYFKLRTRNKLLRKNGMEVLLFVQKILLKENFTFFISFGTLLGIIREKKLLSFDNDLDIALFNKEIDWKKLEKVLTEYKIIKRHEFVLDNKIIEQSYIYKGVIIDFFHNYLENNKLVFNSFIRYPEIIYETEEAFSVKKFLVTPFNKIIPLKLDEEREVYIPDNAQEYLKEVYGKDWQIPDLNWKEEKSLVLERIYNKYAIIKKV